MHVPPIDSGYHKYPESRGSMTQFLAHRVLRFTPSRMPPYRHPIMEYMVPGPSIAPVIRQNQGRRPEKQLKYRRRKDKWLRRENAEIGRMLNEAREDGLLQ